ISAARFHPVNLCLGTVLVDVVLLLAGIAPAVLGILVPFNVLSSAFVHANLNWKLGPLKYFIAGPVFHRWHHTAADRGGLKNFGPTFAFWTCCSGPSTCRSMNCRANMASANRTSRAASAASCSTRSSIDRAIRRSETESGLAASPRPDRPREERST